MLKSPKILLEIEVIIIVGLFKYRKLKGTIILI